jgi:ectoine hydrolase
VTAVDLPFSRAEYDRRLALLAARIDAAGLDALYVQDPSNMAWITGYDGWSFYVHQGVVVKPGEDPLWWGRAMDANGALRTVWMAPDRVTAYGDDFVQADDRHPMQDLATHLAGCRRIGVELDSYYYSAKAHQVLQRRCPMPPSPTPRGW